MLGDDEQKYILASDAGYGFTAKLADLYGKNRAGKTALSLPHGSKALQPRLMTDKDTDFVAAVSNTGHLLIFPLKELPGLTKGKGNKIIAIPGKRVLTREEFVADLAVLAENQVLVVTSGKKQLKLKPKDWQHYLGERGKRGNKLPRAFQNADALGIEMLPCIE